METNIQKWGNSLGVRLPKHIAISQSLKAGSRVVVTETKTGITIEVVKKPRKYTLAELLKGVTKDNIHPETDWGDPVGNEIW
jgi:antitoxin MazE